MGHIKEFPMPFIDVMTDFPSISCLGSQKAGWTVKVGNYFAMGSGPARALSLKPKHTFEVIEYEDDFDWALLSALRAITFPMQKSWQNCTRMQYR